MRQQRLSDRLQDLEAILLTTKENLVSALSELHQPDDQLQVLHGLEGQPFTTVAVSFGFVPRQNHIDGKGEP